MKLKQIAVIYSVLVFCMIFRVYAQIGDENVKTRDMVYYNGQVKQIEAELAEGGSENDIFIIEEKYECDILLTGDGDYQSRLTEYIGKESIIFDYMIDGRLLGKIIWDTDARRYETLRDLLKWEICGVLVLFLLLTYGLLWILYRYYVKPFRTLQEFTSQVAKGNLELALPVRKYNFFGAFTESFDLMRQELKRARESEYRANISKKELIAELSHDIKTPVATIRAACEVMQAQETDKNTLDKITVIANKAEMIDSLVGNLFHATLEELEVLKVESAEESSLCILQMFGDFQYYGKITLENEIPECLLYYDRLRLQQVFDNILNNAYKYAQTEVRVSFQETEEGIVIRIRDFGKGVPEEELALLQEKFYRGSNAEGKSGSGLGLYLAGSFMEQMGGGMEYYNDSGFVVSIFLRKVS